MSDVNANISVSIDTSNALGQLKALQRQISTFHTSIAKSSQTAAAAQADLQKNFLNSVNGIGAFSAELRTVKTSSENFTASLEKNKFSMREYFRYAGASTRTFGRLFKSEFETINKVATENVKNLQTQYIKMGRDANGAMKAIAVRPLTLDMQNLSTQTQIAAQKQALFNQLVKQGSTNLLNFGKNTQWAGRQLMVGFTLPLMALGTAASKTFMDMEAQALKFKKVYGDLFTAPEETQAALDGITELGQAFTKYGIAVSQTVGLAAEAAAAGFKGIDLQRQTTAATKLAVLGQIEQQQALETTISLQNAMGISSEELAQSIDFLNAVENQTVTSLDDITIAIPKVAPVIKSLGGDVKDLAFLMTAMKEGGINASEGANALKSGLASMINPTKKARGMLADFGINIDKIVDGNAGNLKATVIEFSNAINSLKPLDRARIIEQMFGKFQFARLSTLFQNVTKDGTQAARVLDLAGASVQELSALSEKELGMSADSAMNKFKKSVEDLKFALVPVGQVFLEVVAPFIEKISEIIQKFNGLSASTKKIITLVTIGFGAIAPVLLMTVGLLANFVANGVKGLMILRNGYLRLTGQSQILGEQTQYLTTEQQQALAAAHSLEQSHARLIQTFTVESTALGQLKNAYIAATTAAQNFAIKNPAMMVAPAIPTKRSKGKPAVVGGTGNQDTELALLTPGETVIPAPMSEKYGGLINGMIADNIPGYGTGKGSIAEEFISTRPGRSASGGEKAQVNIPGGYQLGHFAPAVQMTGAQLRELALEESAKFQAAVEAMINSVGGDLDRLFDVFTNEVTVQSQAFNQALGEVGSNKQAPIQMFRDEAVTQAGAYNAPLIAKMKQAGASTESVENAVEQLAREFEQGITDLGEVTTVTAEDVNRITEEAYARVADANQDVAAARQELSRPGALKEILGVTPGRTPFSGGYNTKTQREKVNKVVQEQAPGLYPTQQAFNFTGEAARKVGVQNAVAIRQIFDQLNQEAKSRVIGLLGDIDAMSQQVILEAQNAGIDLGKYAIRGITEGIEGQSPSRAARREGQKVVDGFEQGILEGMDDASLAGSRVGNSAVDSLATPGVITRAMGKGRGASRPQGPVPIGPVIPSGASLLPIIAAPIVEANEKVAKSASISASRLASLNKGLNSVSFGLTAAAGAGSMFGGKIGEVSNQIFKYSGLMFGLMQITQLLTQAKATELIASRAAAAGLLVQDINTRAYSKTPGLFAGGIKKLLPNLLRFGGMIARVLGPVGLLITAVGATVGIINRVNAARERERLAIEGLGDAALLSKEKLKNLGQFFGVPTSTSPFRSDKPQVKATTEDRSQIDSLRESDFFKKDYKDVIPSLREATDQQASLIFDSLSVQLRGSGFAKEQIELIIAALKEESGKTKVEFDFNKLDLTTDKGIANFQNQLNELSLQIGKDFSTGYSKRVLSSFNTLTGELTEWTEENLSKSLKRSLNLTAKAFTGFIDGISGQLANGTITADQFNQAFAKIASQISSMPEPQAILILNKIMEVLPENIREAASGLKNVSDRMLILRAQAVGLTGNLLGVIEAMNLLANPTADISDKVFAQMRLDKFKKQLDDATKAFDSFFASKNSGDNTGGTGGEKGLSNLSKKVIEGLKKELKLLEDKKKALQDVNDEIERQQEFQQKQQQLDADMVQAKISGNYIQAALLGQQKLYNKSQYDRETAELDLERQIQRLQDRIDALEKGAKVTDLDKKLSNIEDKVLNAASKSDTKAKADTKNTGTTKNDSSSGGTTPDPKKPAASPDEAKAEADKKAALRPPDLKKLAKEAQRLRSNIVSDGYRNYHHFSALGKDYFVSQYPSRNFVQGKFNPNGGIIITGQPQKFSVGGKVQAFEPGGKVSGPGTSTSDSIPAYLSDGEYVFSARAVDNAGGANVVEGWHNALRRANGGMVRRFHTGGPVGHKHPHASLTSAPHEMGMSSFGSSKTGKKQNWFQRYVSSLTKSNDSLPTWARDPLGSQSLLRKFAGQGRKGDNLNAALMPLNFMGLGLGSRAGLGGAKAATAAGSTLDTSKISLPDIGTLATKAWDDWNDAPVTGDTSWVNEGVSLSQRIESALYNKGSIGKGLANVLFNARAPFRAASRFKSSLLTPLGRAWTYGETDVKGSNAYLSTRLGKSLASNLASPIASLGKLFNPKRLSESVGNFSYLQEKMLGGGTFTDASYSNIFKNIGLDIKRPISTAFNNTKKALNKKFIETSFGRNIELSKQMGDDVPLRKHYIAQGVIDSIPGGLGALIQMSRGIHRSRMPLTGIKSPLERYLDSIVGAAETPMNAFGPGLYSATSPTMSSRYFNDFGSLQYGIGLTPGATLRVLKSKGFINPQQLAKFAEEYTERTGLPAPGMNNINANINHPFMQELIKAGYIGYRHGDAFTNWALGTMPGMSLRAKEFPGNIDPTTVPGIVKPNVRSRIGSSMSNMLSKIKGMGYKPINLVSQYMNYFKAKGLVKKGIFHGSADLGRNSDGPFSGVTDLSGDYARDPYYGMGFYGTTSKSEADLYAGGYNAPGQWGESYGSLNKVTKIPFGKYIDFRKDLKKQNYGLWKLLGGNSFMSAGENLGNLMNQSGMTGSIMPRIATGQTGDPSMDAAIWLALNKPEGTVLKELGSGFAKGGLVKNKMSKPTYSLPSFDTGISYLPKDMIAQLHEGERVLTKEENKNFSAGGTITNNIIINGTDLNKKEIAQEVMIELDRVQKKNNKTNLVAK